MGNGSISAEGLMAKLAEAKKVMKKVDTGSFEKGQVNEEILMSDPMTLMERNDLNDITPINNGVVNTEKINNSKLPDNIKRAMIEKPIIQPEISLTESFDLRLAQKAKRLMEQDSPKSTVNNPKKQTHTQNSEININEMVKTITPIIENTIRKVLDEKLTQILTAKDTSSLNENLVLKVGDSIFKGKITGVKKSK